MNSEGLYSLIPEPSKRDVAKEIFGKFDAVDFGAVTRKAFEGTVIRSHDVYRPTTATNSNNESYSGTGTYKYEYREVFGSVDTSISVAFGELETGSQNIYPETIIFQRHTKGDEPGKFTDRVILDVRVPRDGYYDLCSLVFTRDVTGQVKFSTNLEEHLRGDALRFLNNGETIPAIFDRIRTDLR